MQYINHIGYCGRDDSSEYLAHYGVKGMKWDPRKLKKIKGLRNDTQQAMDRTQMAVNNARAAVADGRKGATRRWDYNPTVNGGAANVYYRTKSSDAKTNIANSEAKAALTTREKQKKELKYLRDDTQAAMDRATMGVNNARAAIADGRKRATRRWEYTRTIDGGRANEYMRGNDRSKIPGEKIRSDAYNTINRMNPLTKKKQSVSLDELKKRKKLYSSWSKK